MRGIIVFIAVLLLMGCAGRMNPAEPANSTEDVSLKLPDSPMIEDNTTAINDSPKNISGLIDKISTNNNISLNSPDVACIFDGICHGTFYLDVYVSPESDLFPIYSNLSTFGEVTGVDCPAGEDCRISFNTDDPEFLNHLLFAPYVRDFEIDSVDSDYEEMLSDEILHHCDAYVDCVMVRKTCCSFSSSCGYTAINIKYQDYWNSEHDCKGVMCPQSACVMTLVPACVGHKCELVEG